MSVVALGLIGAGRWGRRYIHTLAGMADVRLAHLASTNPESASLVPPGCRISADWHDVARDAQLDGLIIATPPALHAEMAETALAAGIPVLIEKPMTLSVTEARRVASRAEQFRRLAMVGHTHLFSAAFRSLKERGRTLGPLQRLRTRAGNNGPWRTDAPVLWDWAPHDLAMCLDLVGTLPEAIDAVRVGDLKGPAGRGEACELCLSFPGGVNADIRVSNIDAEKSRYFEAAFRNGTLIYDDLATEKLCLLPPGGGPARPLAIEASLPLTNLVAEFCEAIRAGTQAHASLALGVHVVELLDHCDALLAASPDRIANRSGLR